MMFGYGATTIKGDRPTGPPVEGALQSIRVAKRQRQTQSPLEAEAEVYCKDYCLKLRSLSSVNVWAFGQQPALEAFSPSCFMVKIYLYTIICTSTIRRNNYCVTADTKFNTNVLAFPD